MFDESSMQLLTGIDKLVQELVILISQSGQTISNHLSSVYSICWDDNKQTKLIDPETLAKIRACRDSLFPDLNDLCNNLNAARELVGIEREELDLDVMAVDSLENTIQRKMDDAENRGEVIDLCDSDEEIEAVLSRLPPARSMLRVKAEPTNDNWNNRYGLIGGMDSDSDDSIDLLDD
mmetsp:Transcript_20904/g.30612  ORF Transcript_20904/g.30612 Transcript_20904/m.30612 type:complete len:178 (-) Transcript_20904:139-672(-)